MQIIYGKNSVETYIQYAPNLVFEILLYSGVTEKTLKEVEALAVKAKISYRMIEKKELSKLVDGKAVHQGICAKVKDFEYRDIHEVLGDVKASGKIPFFILIDQMQDPRNLGAILRTADCTGIVDGIIITEHNSCDVSAAAIKTSTGAALNIPVIKVKNSKSIIDLLKKEGIWICGVDMVGAQTYRKQAYDMPLCLVIGGEDKGIRPIIKREMDFNVYIPMHSKTVNSLNVSVATSLLVYEVMHQRME
ncbi:23S rRNA mG2251 2'-O-ribose methyltransferase [Erysipelotrichaceae bacterium]|nr:23S rRNA mG2251 2'-O-ribose methyltransferase [Erysipelotrichaceae bacterium]